MHDDLSTDIAAALFARQQLQAMRSQADRVVSRHGALVLEAKDLLGVQLGWQRAVGRAIIGGRHGELGVEARQIGRQNRVGLL